MLRKTVLLGKTAVAESFNCSVLIQGICTVTSHICICINVSFVNGSFCQENQSLLFFKQPYLLACSLVNIYKLYFLLLLLPPLPPFVEKTVQLEKTNLKKQQQTFSLTCIIIIVIILVIYGLYFLQEGSPLKNDGSGIVIPVINL